MVKEIVLCGIHTGQYSSDGKRLSNLIEDMSTVDQIKRIRLSSVEIVELDDGMMKVIKNNKKFVSHLHIPLQAGSDKILKSMNRRYDLKYFKEKVDQIRSLRKDIALSTDVIVGFPGETEEQFQNTLKVMTDLELDYSNTAAYSPREGTVAAKWIDLYIPDNVKEERLARLNEHNRECCLASNQKYVGREMEVLIENFEVRKNGDKVITGRTRNNKIVHIKSDKDLSGEFVVAKITKARTWYLNGELV